MSGKGSRQRPTDKEKFDEAFDRIFGVKCQHDWCSDGDPGLGEVMTFTCSRCGKETKGVSPSSEQ